MHSTFAEKVLASRTEKGWTQEQAAAQIGVHEMTFWRWENGATTPTFSNLQRLADVFGWEEAR